MPQPAEAMQTPGKLQGWKLELEGGLAVCIQDATGKRKTAIHDFVRHESVDCVQIRRRDDDAIDPEPATLNEGRRQHCSRLPHLPPTFGDVKRNQSGAIIDSHTASCHRILMIRSFRLSGRHCPKK
jgi:hypothetical protein